MVTVKDFPHFPKCKLISYLLKRANESPEKRLDLLSQLEKFRDKIADESIFIWDTLPEFMPHDEKHHLDPMFHVSDLIIGEGYKKFNFAELYLLAAGIYGHDWGMAISKKSKKFILNQSLPNANFDDNTADLPKERELFLKFVKSEGIMVQADKNFEKISDKYWQKFVRDTHAERSSYRVSTYFKNIDELESANAVSKICLGHSLNFQNLERDDYYPKNYPVFGETVNLKAITLYLRVIDLMDIGKSRASHNIFDFISPTDKQSLQHWEKNFSINPITVSNFSARGRQIHVRGTAKNPDIYAELEDQKNERITQLEKTEKIFAYMNDPRHSFDIVYLDWNIEPDGFKRISIKFEFEREEIFKILSSEIYQRDPFVFLRELLQNSIDAIRLKKEFYKRIDESPAFSGLIKVDITHNVDGKISIKWFDNGIGMDEYIVKNYLSIIGKSFYEKSNLEQLGIKLDPISKFGIGILSCFYVAKCIEIKTQKDTVIKPESVPLKITIPDVNKQFRVTELPPGSIEQGTLFSLITDKEKFSLNKLDSLEGEFTNYLSEIAGFVEFPIIISENGKETILQHPNKKSNEISKKYPRSKIKKISYDYPFSSLFLFQDAELAKEKFAVKTLNIRSDLKLNNYEGAISFLVLHPSLEVISPSRNNIGASSETNCISVFDQKNPSIEHDIRWYNIRFGIFDDDLPQSKKSIKKKDYAIFKDGILLRDEANPLIKTYHDSQEQPYPFLNVNILSKRSNEINLARTNLLESEKHWFDQIDNALIKFVIKKEISPHNTKTKKERWYLIGRLIWTYPIKVEKLILKLPRKQIPLVGLGKNGKIQFFNLSDLTADTLLALPQNLINEFTELLCQNLIYKKKYDGILNNWLGNPCFGIESRSYDPFKIPSISRAYEFSCQALRNEYICSELLFLHPPNEQNPPLKQKIYRRNQKKGDPISFNLILEKASNNVQSLTPHEIDYINQTREWKYSLQMPEIYSFQGSLSNYFAFAWDEINLKHPLSQKIIQIIAKLQQNELSEHDQIFYGKINDQLLDLQHLKSSNRNSNDEAEKDLKKILKYARELCLISDAEIEKYLSMNNLFIPRSFIIDYYWPKKTIEYNINPLFGKTIE